MQYILTEEEYNQLKNDPKNQKSETDKIIADLCRMVADNKVIKREDVNKLDKSFWREEAPWKCIRSTDYEWYCDLCPVKKICTWPHKNYSK
jgi:hypothetical protein